MRIVLAYSGGLDTSVLLSWIKETYGADVIAFCANIGQEEELAGLAMKARKTGAAKIYIDDLQEEFARDLYPKRLGSLQIDNQLELRGLLDRQVARFCAFENLLDVRRGAVVQIRIVHTIGHEAAIFDKLARRKHCGQFVLGGEVDDEVPVGEDDAFYAGEHSVDALSHDAFKGAIDRVRVPNIE